MLSESEAMRILFYLYLFGVPVAFLGIFIRNIYNSRQYKHIELRDVFEDGLMSFASWFIIFGKILERIVFSFIFVGMPVSKWVRNSLYNMGKISIKTKKEHENG